MTLRTVEDAGPYKERLNFLMRSRLSRTFLFSYTELVENVVYNVDGDLSAVHFRNSGGGAFKLCSCDVVAEKVERVFRGNHGSKALANRGILACVCEYFFAGIFYIAADKFAFYLIGKRFSVLRFGGDGNCVEALEHFRAEAFFFIGFVEHDDNGLAAFLGFASDGKHLLVLLVEGA